MSVAETERKLVSVICEHYLSGSPDKLTIVGVSKKVGISRQAFHKNYMHLKPYINGQLRVDELLLREGVDTAKIIVEYQRLVRELQAEIENIRSSQAKEFKRFESTVLTSLMNGDFLMHRAAQLTTALKQKSLHNEILKIKLLEREVDAVLTEESARKIPEPAIHPLHTCEKLKPDMVGVVSKISRDQDSEDYLKCKKQAIDAMRNKLLKILRQGNIRVVIFQERYLCSFDKFCERLMVGALESVVAVNLPLAFRQELKVFVSGLVGARPLELFVPFCESEAIINAQRAFLFGQIPGFEFKDFNRESLPTIYDGFDRVTVFRVALGD